MPGKANPQFFQLEKGKSAYNTDYNNLAPNVGIAWTPAPRGGFLGTLMSEEFVFRAGWARAFSRNGMNDFTGQYNSNPGVVVSANRNAGLLNIIPPGGSAPVLFRNDANLFPGAFPATPVYPMTDVVTGDIRMFSPDIEIPYADSWSAGIQRKISTNMAAEIRYVGTLSRDLWQARNFNEVNIVENGFLDEFRAAQRNLQANIADGRGCTFAFTGMPGTAPLPILLAHFNSQPFANAGNSTLYTGDNWTSSAFLALLAQRNPNPYGFANVSSTGNASATALIGNATFRNAAIAAGVPRNFFVANPDLIGGAFLTRNEGFTDYHSMQLELRRRLAQGLQFQTSYVFGKAMQSGFLSHRVPLQQFRDVGTPGDIAHQFKANVVYDLPFGQGRRFMGGAGALMERLVGGWQVGVNAKIQSGRLMDIGNVRLVGWTRDDVQKNFKLRFDHAGKVIFNFPEDVVTNTIRAFNVSPTTASGYSGEAPEGDTSLRRTALTASRSSWDPATAAEPVELVLQGPMFQQTDLRLAKRTQIVGRVNFEFAAEALNVFNQANFVPNGQSSSTTLNNWRVTTLTGTNTARVIQLVSRINW